MFSRMRLLCIRQSPIQLQTSTRYFSSKGPVSIKRPQADPVKTHLPPSDTSKSTKSRNNRSPDLNLLFFDSYNISLNQVSPLKFFGLQVSQLDLPLKIQNTLMIFCTGVATAPGRSRAAKQCRR